ncbi:SKIP/SNW domain containing protein [Trichomonas vaginalis G3]|uniref:SKIP/SNW domain containing protein n=1 Tax=Trichomonas vaginalis (strain ATCC PRA-98 / G3) TaxID=412133 RepID=A2DHZ9_TRIV3|nr:nuclear protein, SKIP-related family [Trichomonas vaginalis G3]EAY19988.1 SKIP/SNW domain containing protein [Trichomonas vaginalis G3]KAI5525939.1 nuclear protein, SKIP-related family [Trichomonas vaginalis G3]|eukprot:XP_001580974.1 SKIP/SNW domain containing protein [Trichomonas vaginalis G3]
MTITPYKTAAEVTPLIPSKEEIAQNLKAVKEAIETNVQIKQGKQIQAENSIHTVRFHTDEKDYTVRVADRKVDPFDPARFRTRKVIELQEKDPEPILTAPVKKLTPEEEKYWYIPPVISNWKNPAGNVIPMDKRVAADGRRNIKPELNDKFAFMNRALEATMQSINEAAHQRAIQQRQLLIKQQEEEKEQQREEVRKLREEKMKIAALKNSEERSHDKLIEEHNEERKRLQNRRRDVSGRVAPGFALVSTNEEVFDNNLFGKNGGIDQGFIDEESNNAYDAPLFRQPTEKAYVPFAESRKSNAVNLSALSDSKKAGASSFTISFKKGNAQKPISNEGLYIPDKE